MQNHSLSLARAEAFGASYFVRAFLLAGFVAAAVRGGLRSLFELRRAAPVGLALPGELLASLLAGVSSGALQCDDGGRFALASEVSTWRAVLDERAAAPRVRTVVERMAGVAEDKGVELSREVWIGIVDNLARRIVPPRGRLVWIVDVTRRVHATRTAAAKGVRS